MKPFIDLHCHSQYSILDGYASIDDYIKNAKENNLKAICITDHGSMSGAIELYTKCKKEGVKPLIAQEFYLTSNTKEKIRDNHHLILIAKNFNGYKNLVKLTTEASEEENFYYKPRITYNLLKKYKDDLICTSACIGSDINQAIIEAKLTKAENLILFYRNLFADDFYLEFHNHFIEEEQTVNKVLKHFSEKYSIKTIIANDVHYIKKDDAKYHDMLLCKNVKKVLSDKERFRFYNDEFYYKTRDEIEKLFPDYGKDFVNDCIDNIHEIIDKCNVEIEIGVPKMPHYPFVENESEAFKKEVLKGMIKRYGKNPDKSIFERVNYEISVIRKMGFEGYFLIVQDYIQWAKDNDIPVGPGRGSAGASIVCYCMGITEVCPLKYNLPFERFLNPDRIGLPDIDTDFCIEGRDRVAEYLKEKYGLRSVSNIATFGYLKSRSAIKEVARIYEYPYEKVNEITKKMSPSAKNMTIQEELDSNPDFKSLYNNDEDMYKIIDTALKLEGKIQNMGCHAGGYIIADFDITDICPIIRGVGNTRITAFSMEEVEKIGLVKYDILGLKNLTIVKHCLDYLRGKDTNINFNVQDMTFDDEKTYRLLQNGFSAGIFQLESDGMIKILKELCPTELKHLDAVLALFRPGPIACGAVDKYIENRHNPEKITYEYPQLKPILEDTYGNLCYQEQIMRIATDLAGYTMSQADELRKGIGKKKQEIIDEHRDIFVNGCIENNIDKEFADNLYNSIEGFGSYCFNKSHSLLYSIISYQTAYLKANYTPEYMTCLLNYEANQEKLKKYLNECFRLGIKVLPPDINKSQSVFAINDNGDIVFGFGAIKGMGEAVIKKIITERENGEFKSFWDFVKRVPEASKTALECLIKVGAFKEIVDNSKCYLTIIEYIQKGKSSTEYKKGMDLIEATNLAYAKQLAKEDLRHKSIELEIKSIIQKVKELTQQRKLQDSRPDKKRFTDKINDLENEKANYQKRLNEIISEKLETVEEYLECEDFSRVEYSEHEEELLSFPISCHPLILFSAHEKHFKGLTDISDLLNDDICSSLIENEEEVKIIATVKKKNIFNTSIGDSAIINLEYLGNNIAVKFAPWIWEKINGRNIKKNSLVLIKLTVKDAYNKNFGNYDYNGLSVNVLDFMNKEDNEIIFNMTDKNKEHFDNFMNVLTSISNMCYNENKNISYIVGLKKGDKKMILPSKYWVSNKLELMRQLVDEGVIR